jgi:hypothetical protein
VNQVEHGWEQAGKLVKAARLNFEAETETETETVMSTIDTCRDLVV